MATLVSVLYYFKGFVLFIFVVLFVPTTTTLGQSLLSCNTNSPEASGYHCNSGAGSQDQCGTFAILRTNSYYSSLYNLSFYLGLNRFVIAQANGFSAETQFLPKNQPLLIPIYCKCNGDGFFQADLSKTSIKGESFLDIAESLEGLTTCKAIQDKNPNVSSPWNLADNVRLQVPLRCACPSSTDQNLPQTRLLLSYPVSEGDTVSHLAIKFNTTPEAIISENNKSSSETSFKPESLIPFTSLLIPLNGEPTLGSLSKPSEPNFHFPTTSSNTNIPAISTPTKKSRMMKLGAYIALSGVVVGGCIAIAAAVVIILLKKKKQEPLKQGGGDLELQHLSQSIRTTSDKKVSFEGSQCALDIQIIDSTPLPQKMLLESYAIEELRRATEDFSSSNHIEGAVYHGRLSGKNLAIKRTKPEIFSKIDMQLFQNATHHHPNIIRLLGTCLSDGPHSFLVFEYAKNGSLKDWLHGGLAMKNQFIASCYCFLTWGQRLRICLDVAMALQYMHHVMNPSYVHRNIKSRNIFLDEELYAKVGNFGMAKCVEDDADNPQFYSTNPASWSMGYLAPEYIHERVIAPSIDIFAYGVVLLEVLSGQTPINYMPKKKEEGSVWLSEKIRCLLQSENADDLREWIDSALGDNYSFDGAVTLANIARACVEEDPETRPSAGEIVEKLARLVEELPQGEHTSSICESSSKPLVNASATKQH